MPQSRSHSGLSWNCLSQAHENCTVTATEQTTLVHYDKIVSKRESSRAKHWNVLINVSLGYFWAVKEKDKAEGQSYFPLCGQCRICMCAHTSLHTHTCVTNSRVPAPGSPFSPDLCIPPLPSPDLEPPQAGPDSEQGRRRYLWGSGLEWLPGALPRATPCRHRGWRRGPQGSTSSWEK